MTRTQKLQLRQSELRQKMGDMLDTDPEKRSESYDDDLAAMSREMRGIETQIQAAILAEPEPVETRDDAEGREMRDLIGRAKLGNVFDSVVAGRETIGAESELQKALGMNANYLPLALLRETRAVTPAPANVGQTQAPIVPYVFPESAAAFLGIDMPTVGIGDAVFPVLTAELDVHTPAENAAAAETTGAFSADVLSPARLQAAFFYSREDRARFAMMEESLRENLSAGLADGLDKQVIAGTNGLLGSSGLTARSGDASAVATFATYRGLVYEAAKTTIDGRYAATAGDVRQVMGPHSYGHAAGVYRSNNADDSALDSLVRVSGGVRVSAHVADPASNDQAVIVRKGMRRDMVAAIWDGVELIYDPITKAGNGQIVITAVMLHAVKILRNDGFQRRVVQVA